MREDAKKEKNHQTERRIDVIAESIQEMPLVPTLYANLFRKGSRMSISTHFLLSNLPSILAFFLKYSRLK